MKSLNESLNYVKESKPYIWLSVFVFFLFSFIGFIFPMFQEQIFRIIQELSGLFEGKNLWETTGLIFFNNARASIIAIITGIFFGVFPLIIALGNGYLVGFVSRFVTDQTSILEIWRLVPHGIFELPAVLISVGFGLKIGIEVLTKPGKENLFRNLEMSLKAFVLIVLPLLAIAAIIEGLLIIYF